MNYTQLLEAIASWLHRNDLSTPAPTFVQLAEARLRRELRMSRFAGIATLTVLAGQSAVDLPADYLEGRALTGGSGDWTMRSAEALARLKANGSSDQDYTVVGGQIVLPFNVGGNTDLTLAYYKAITALTTTPTNWLLTNHPDVYLWPALAEAAVYTQDDALEAKYEARAARAIAEVQADDKAATWFAAELHPDYVV